jgi:hypothetical protein
MNSKYYIYKNDNNDLIYYKSKEDFLINAHNRHRAGGPAFISTDPHSNDICKYAWYKHGKKHRLNAPAWIYKNTNAYPNQYWEFGVQI